MRAMSRVGLLVLVAAVCWAAPRSASAGPRRAVDFEPVWVGTANDIQLTGDYVFGDEASWCAFWQAVKTIERIPPLTCPAVDFRRELVIATVGSFGTCTGQGISAIERVGSRRAVEVTVVEHYPDPTCLCVLWFHGSVSAVVVAKPVGDVAFTHVAEQFSCSE